MKNRFYLKSPQILHLPQNADGELMTELFSNFAYGVRFTVLKDAPENTFYLGAAKNLTPASGECILAIDADGITVTGVDFSAMMRGFTVLLEKIRQQKTDRCWYAEEENCEISPDVGIRFIHLCVFPETKLEFLQKCIRSFALVRFSHVVLEFWGMLQFDCMKELSWPCAYTKEQLRPLIREANALGMEVVPMFNHLGHAAACRSRYGKHVVLDQNPAYEYMFNSYGWVWDFSLPEVRELLRKVRAELMEICGPGKYFHLGCDEADGMPTDTETGEALCVYLNGIEAELEAEGRQAIIWGDMMLCRSEFADTPESGECLSTPELSAAMFRNLSRNIIIADWHYNVKTEYVWKTSLKFAENGFRVLAAPWHARDNIRSAMISVKEGGFMGLMQTTWHTLYQQYPSMLYSGLLSYNKEQCASLCSVLQVYAAHISRKALPACGDIEKAGWSENTVGPGHN